MVGSLAADSRRDRLASLYAFDGLFIDGEKAHYVQDRSWLNQQGSTTRRDQSLDLYVLEWPFGSIQIFSGCSDAGDSVNLAGINISELRLLDLAMTTLF